MRTINLVIGIHIIGFLILFGLSSCTSSKTTKVILPINDSIEGWMPGAIRPSLRPEFSYSSRQGYKNEGNFIISMGNKSGLQGYWAKTFKVKSDRYYRFTAFKKTKDVKNSVKSAFVTIEWRDSEGKSVEVDSSVHLLGSSTFDDGKVSRWASIIKYEFPSDQADKVDGWTKVSNVYKVPSRATQAVVRLYLMWAPRGLVKWSGITFSETDMPPKNIVRIATVQYGPVDTIAKTTQGAISLFEPMIKEASQKKAKIICLPEFLTSKFSSVGFVQSAHPIPGPDSKYLGELAKKYSIYIVAGLIESQAEQIFNTAVLIGPDGTLIGKYRKVAIPTDEYLTLGISPGNEYPVFQTSFGKIGMMICWDGQYPSIARRLRDKGAEIIFLPVAGINPKLISASAIVNQVYIVSSTFSTMKNWIRSGIFDYEGNMIASGKYKGEVVIADVDLNSPKLWVHIGDLREKTVRQRPDPE